MSYDEIMSRDLLNMKLHDVSDVLLQEMCKRGKTGIKVSLPGCCLGDGTRMRLSVCLEEVKK